MRTDNDYAYCGGVIIATAKEIERHYINCDSNKGNTKEV